MQCSDIEKDLANLACGEDVETKRLAIVEAHLLICAECQDRFEAFQETVQVLREVRGVEVPQESLDRLAAKIQAMLDGLSD